MTHLRFKHLYEFYPLYKALYRTSPLEKLGESLANVALINHAVKNGHVDRILQITEILGGHADHAKYLLDNLPYEVSAHYVMDIVAHRVPFEPPIRSIVGDALKDVYYPRNTNVVLANYLSISSLTDSAGAGLHHPRVLQELFRNVYTVLKQRGGVFIVDTLADGYGSALSDVGEAEGTIVLSWGTVKHHALLRALEVLPGDDGDYRVKYKTRTEYDRRTQVNTTTYETLEIHKGDECAFTVRLDNPFVERYWNVSDILTAADQDDLEWSDIVFQRSVPAENGFDAVLSILDQRVTEESDDVSEIQPNRLMFCVPEQ